MSELVKREEYNGLALPQHEWDLCDVLVGINQLRSFNLTGIEILEYKDSLMRIAPTLDPKLLQYAIDQMMIGNIDYHKDKGIQNIFNALKNVGKREDGTFYLKRSVY